MYTKDLCVKNEYTFTLLGFFIVVETAAQAIVHVYLNFSELIKNYKIHAVWWLLPYPNDFLVYKDTLIKLFNFEKCGVMNIVLRMLLGVV